MQISYYESHTDKTRQSRYYEDVPDGTLQQLAQAVEEFWDALRDPDGDFIASGLSPFYHTAKLHYLRHYVEYVRRMGTLPQCSTDRSEALHRTLKAAFNASNKGANALDFVVKYERQQTGMKYFVTDLEAKGMPIKAASLTSLDDDGVAEVDENNGVGIEELEVQRVTARQGVYPMGKYESTKFPMELEAAQEFLGLQAKCFLTETLRTLMWIRNNREGIHRRRREVIQLPGVNEIEVIAVFTAIKVVYPMQAGDEHMAQESIRCMN